MAHDFEGAEFDGCVAIWVLNMNKNGEKKKKLTKLYRIWVPCGCRWQD